MSFAAARSYIGSCTPLLRFGNIDIDGPRAILEPECACALQGCTCSCNSMGMDYRLNVCVVYGNGTI